MSGSRRSKLSHLLPLARLSLLLSIGDGLAIEMRGGNQVAGGVPDHELRVPCAYELASKRRTSRRLVAKKCRFAGAFCGVHLGAARWGGLLIRGSQVRMQTRRVTSRAVLLYAVVTAETESVVEFFARPGAGGGVRRRGRVGRGGIGCSAEVERLGLGRELVNVG